ncbi:MAG TPA: D-alanyl-D-alanine carboxypeptidase/D-alanyl-D-alanine-endopeptidase [Gemmatimonadaceae bacterium]|nr:D-alanyl-D-alanine carboxypeptidase/D-alanyl-D-alanine-endopeptidase [Gemmatimonadaceae bacterium]
MRRPATRAWALSMLLGACVPQARPGRVEARVGDLRAAIDSVVAQPAWRNAHWGLLIVDPATGDTLYSRNAAKLFMPASNMKLVTGAVALAQLGPDFRFRTTYARRGSMRGDTLVGDLVVLGRGDPTASDSMRGDALLPLREAADSLLARRIRRVRGDVRAEGDAFPDPIHGMGWAWDDFDYAYSAGVDELMFNEGFSRLTVRASSDSGALRVTPAVPYPPVSVSVTRAAPAVPGGAAVVSGVELTWDAEHDRYRLTGSLAAGDSATMTVAHRDPRTAFLAALRQAMADRGIAVNRGPAAAGPLDTLFVTLSPPLRDVLRAMEKPSQNQIAEVLLKTLGLERTGVGGADSGRRVVADQLAAWGVAADGFAIADGSGLSRHNYLTPETIVRVLDAARRDTAFAVFYDALPVAGVDGTIATRMRGTAAEGNVRAKTGYIDKARSLSGYATTADGRLLIFSMLCNNFTTPVRDVERVQDAIAARLAALTLGTGAQRR